MDYGYNQRFCAVMICEEIVILNLFQPVGSRSETSPSIALRGNINDNINSILTEVLNPDVPWIPTLRDFRMTIL